MNQSRPLESSPDRVFSAAQQMAQQMGSHNKWGQADFTTTNGVKPILQCEVQCLGNKWGDAWGHSKNSSGLLSRLR